MRAISKALPFLLMLSLGIACISKSAEPELGTITWIDPNQPLPMPPFGDADLVSDAGSSDARFDDADLPRSPLRDAAGPPTARWFVDPIDAVGSGIEIQEVELTLEDGIFAMFVATPGIPHTTPLRTDHLEIYIDTQRRGGFDLRVVLDGSRASPFSLQRWDVRREIWVEHMPRSFMVTFGRGFSFQVDASEVGIGGALDFALLSIDGLTGDVSDRAPDGAFAERWTYRPFVSVE